MRILSSHRFHSLSKLKIQFQYLTKPHQSSRSQFRLLNTSTPPKTKKPLDILFKEAVGLSPNPQPSDSDNESQNDNLQLKNKLKKLELQIRSLKDNTHNPNKDTNTDKWVSTHDPKPRSLYAVFTNGEKPRNFYNVFADRKPKKEYFKRVEEKRDDGGKPRSLYDVFNFEKSENKRRVEPIVYKELSSDMAFFANHLYKLGYFDGANFLPKGFDVTCFENNYGRDFLKFAAEKFGRDHQEIAKWLSGSDLKKVAGFVCPSLAKKIIFSAKTLRVFFKIQEDTVCSKCVLNKSCKFVNQSVWKSNTKALDLSVVMRVITLYALDSGPPQLVVPDEIKASVSRLMKEVQNLSETVR